MSNIVTTWVLEFKDMLSSGLNKAKKAVDSVQEAVKDLGDSNQLTGAKAVKALANEKQHRKDLQTEIKEQERLLKELEKSQTKAIGSKQWREEQKAIKDVKDGLASLRADLKAVDKDIEELSKEVDTFKSKQEGLTNVAFAWNQLTDVVQKFAESLDFAQVYKDIEANIKRMTGASGDALDEATGRVYKMSAVYGDAGEDVAQAANAMSKSLGVSYSEALTLIEQGYQKGANLNGDMLEQIKEYSSVLAPLGYTAEEVMAKLAMGNKSGVFNDKMLDTLKEANLSLREMGKAQTDALAGIGLLPSDLKDKTVKEAIEAVGAAMDATGVTVQERQVVIANIFKAAGEDMGMFITEGLMHTPEWSQIPIVEQSGTYIRSFMADVQSFMAQSFGEVAIAAQQLAPVFTGVGSAITLFQSLSKVTALQTIATKIATVAQNLFNKALRNNPIGWVITIVALLVTAIMSMTDKFDWAAGVVGAVKNSFMEWGKVLLNWVLFPVKQVIGFIKSLWSLLQGDWTGAWKNLTDPAKELNNSINTAVNATTEGYNQGVEEKHAKDNAGTTDPNESVPTAPAVGGIKGPTAPVSYSGSGRGSGSGSGGDNGLSVSGNGSGGRSLTMNLTINNTFSGIKSDLDIRDVADKVSGIIVDRLRDATISFG